MKRLILDNPFGAPVFYKESLDSTMTWAAASLSSELKHGTVFMAGKQESGRGRLAGRKWHSSADENLLFTLVFSLNQLKKPELLTLTAATALCCLLKQGFQLSAKVKWPNDVLIQSKKISGILGEIRKDHVLLGMGINLNQEDFPEEIRDKAGSLYQFTQKKLNRDSFLISLLDNLKIMLKHEDPAADINPFLAFKGKPIIFLPGPADNKEKIQGILKGINQYGGLLIQQKLENTLEFYSGELLWKEDKR